MNGYILYSASARKGVVAKHPQLSFGEISRIVGANVGRVDYWVNKM